MYVFSWVSFRNVIIGIKLWNRITIEIEYELRGVKSKAICLILGVISNKANVNTPKSNSNFSFLYQGHNLFKCS